ncbi:T9SS type A sorting domain-containing protein [Rasiella sp. SM2506]|uniref:T9SS type A sorting domain-containing protein n=1 Tax=Rasiella sp. SM2506 TaxID=3423914 RepID=UPI003D78E6B6
MKLKLTLLSLLMAVVGTTLYAQQTGVQGASGSGFLADPIIVPSIAKQIQDGSFVPAETEYREAPPKRQYLNPIVPGKGSSGPDLALQTNPPTRQGGAPFLTFDADTTPQAGVTDPTGAIGPNHYVAAWNFSFRIFDRDGNPLTPEASLASIFPGNAIGDPIIIYDQLADRFLITEFDSNPNGFNVAVSQGPDPVNDGWYVYTTGFGTGSFPDYTKFSVWPDGYYVTANVGTRRVYAVEREKMLVGEAAQFQDFQLGGISTFGFYSPQGSHVTAGSHPEFGDFTVAYMQDDAWSGVSNDHIKLWTINTDWETPSNSTISSPQQLDVADFIGVFDNGSFSNLQQPNGVSIDALQATVMNQMQYRQFLDYNSLVLNWVVDTDPTGGELAGVRWYELRQTAAGQPWTIFQEGTYTTGDPIRHAFSASMAMDIYGNIGMAYSSVSTAQSLSIRYTGRLNGDPVGNMTIAESLIAQSTSNSSGSRVADYVHLTVDPVSDRDFWHIAEYFNPNRRDVVGAFNLNNPIAANDVAIVNITPDSGELTASEEITVTIENYGTTAQTSIPVSYNVDGGTAVSETYSGSIAPGATDTYTFTVPADLSGTNQLYRIEARTELAGDNFEPNDFYGENIRNQGEILSVTDLEIGNSELIVYSKDNKVFNIVLNTTYDKVLPLTVYDVTGKQIVFNNIVNENNKYSYKLDMSYMAAGVYLVNVGRGAVQKTAKIIVK